jgi:hypothetical protein
MRQYGDPVVRVLGLPVLATVGSIRTLELYQVSFYLMYLGPRTS